MPAEACLDRALEKKGDVRVREGRRPYGRHSSSAPLVGKRRVVIAVGDHHLAVGERGRDDLGDQLPAGRHEKVHLRFSVDVQPLVQEDVADLLTQLGAAWLAHQDRVTPLQPLGQKLGLSGLARALGAFERDEQAALRHPCAGSLGGLLRSGSDAQPALGFLASAAGGQLVLRDKLVLQPA